MNNHLPDRTVILAIFATIIMIFSLIFLWRPSQNELQPSIQWRDQPMTTNEALEIKLYKNSNCAAPTINAAVLIN